MIERSRIDEEVQVIGGVDCDIAYIPGSPRAVCPGHCLVNGVMREGVRHLIPHVLACCARNGLVVLSPSSAGLETPETHVTVCVGYLFRWRNVTLVYYFTRAGGHHQAVRQTSKASSLRGCGPCYGGHVKAMTGIADDLVRELPSRNPRRIITARGPCALDKDHYISFGVVRQFDASVI